MNGAMDEFALPFTRFWVMSYAAAVSVTAGTNHELSAVQLGQQCRVDYTFTFFIGASYLCCHLCG